MNNLFNSIDDEYAVSLELALSKYELQIMVNFILMQMMSYGGDGSSLGIM